MIVLCVKSREIKPLSSLPRRGKHRCQSEAVEVNVTRVEFSLDTCKVEKLRATEINSIPPVACKYIICAAGDILRRDMHVS